MDVTFTFDASDLKAKDKVVAESLSLNGKELASHADIEDKSQTVTITKPTLSTTAVDSLDADKNLIGEGDATIVDTVKYKNVTPGKTYKVSGTPLREGHRQGRQGLQEAAPRCRRQPLSPPRPSSFPMTPTAPSM